MTHAELTAKAEALLVAVRRFIAEENAHNDPSGETTSRDAVDLAHANLIADFTVADVDAILTAFTTARNDALEEAATASEDWPLVPRLLPLCSDVENSCAMTGQNEACERIAVAIRALKSPPARNPRQGHGFNSDRTENPMYAPLSEKDGET